ILSRQWPAVATTSLATQKAVHTERPRTLNRSPSFSRTSAYLPGSGLRSSLPNTAAGSTVAAPAPFGRACQAREETGPARTHANPAIARAALVLAAGGIASSRADATVIGRPLQRFNVVESAAITNI